MERGAKWRPAVAAFADLMEARLREHDDRRGGDTWGRVADPLDLAEGIVGNTEELVAKLREWMTPGMFDAKPDNMAIMRQAADVANFAMMVADRCGPLPLPTVEAIAFRVSSDVLEHAHAIDGGLEVHVAGPDSIMVHVIAGDVEGVLPVAMPIAIDTVADAVKAVREFLAEPGPSLDGVVQTAEDYRDGLFMHQELRARMLPHMMTPNTCGVADGLGELEVWLDANGVDVDARCYPPVTAESRAELDALLDGDPLIDTRKHEEGAA